MCIHVFPINIVDTVVQEYMETLNEDELEATLTKSIGISSSCNRIPLHDLAWKVSKPFLGDSGNS